MSDPKIVRAAIHPAVGIARVGNSREGTYLGPEVYPTPVLPPGSYRDDSGALKRQVARFRVFGYDQAGNVVRELTADDADVRWSAHLANSKAAWYQWILALDIPEAAKIQAPRRNPKVVGDERKTLVVDGGRRSIQGRNASGPDHQFVGRFLTMTSVYLGELRTDEAGRLLVLPGHGASASPVGAPIYDEEHNPNPFINADGWYDDVADGPVTAEVTVDGQTIPCESAWVVTAPPDYAPNVVATRTLYDLLYDLFVQAKWLDFPSTISFRRDVYPILHRLTGLSWVNRGFEVQFGPSGPFPFGKGDFVARMADPSSQAAELRRQVFNTFRVPQDPSPLQLPWPWIYGDAMDVPAGDSPRQNATLSPTQYRVLAEWAAGRFEADWDPRASHPGSVDDLPAAEQPASLDRAALEYALADAFHPGCEVTWPVRHLSMWKSPFRLHHRPPGQPEPDYGEVLTQEIALSPDGPLHAQGPGDLSRWMGLPWQADTAFCRSGYDKDYDPYVPTFWPATVPNQVLTPEIYREILEAGTPEEAARAYGRRFSWTRPLAPAGKAGTGEQMDRMVKIFGSMGFLEVLPGPKGNPAVPEELMVASFGPDVHAKEEGEMRLAAAAAPAAGDEGHTDTNWTSAEERRRAPLPVRVPKEGSGGKE